MSSSPGPPTASPAIPAPPSGATPARGPRATGVMLRFVSCGLVSLAVGATWRLTLAPRRVEIGSALLGIVLLLTGFAVGGILWYLRDARARMRSPELVDDDRIVFSFVVFVLMPLAVLVVVGLVWLLALVVGSA